MLYTIGIKLQGPSNENVLSIVLRTDVGKFPQYIFYVEQFDNVWLFVIYFLLARERICVAANTTTRNLNGTYDSKGDFGWLKKVAAWNEMKEEDKESGGWKWDYELKKGVCEVSAFLGGHSPLPAFG